MPPPIPRAVLRDAMLMAGLVALQIMLAPLIAIGPVVPDFVLVGLLFVAARRGRLTGAVVGFCAGLVIDLGLGEVVGLFALAKTITGFAAGYLLDEEHPGEVLRTPRFVLAALALGVLHNLLSLLAYFRTLDQQFFSALLEHGVGGAIYSTVFTSVSVLILSRIAHRIDVQE
ncbi:MAG: rod shape-determining protein MreD [Ignavibacteria bacterium]|nr:rod shape-determining protein MreD [Ignavibacteria bacterium]